MLEEVPRPLTVTVRVMVFRTEISMLNGYVIVAPGVLKRELHVMTCNERKVLWVRRKITYGYLDA